MDMCREHEKLFHMVENLDGKLGNGWAREVKDTLKEVQKDIGQLKTDVALLKERPRNRALVYKDIVLFVTAAGALITMGAQVFGG